MELVVEDLDAKRKKLKIKIPEDVISQKVNNAYKQLNKTIKVPGFRSGKIPQNILEKQVPIQSFSEMFQELMQEYYEKALKETGFQPAGQPEIDHSELKDIKKDKPLSFAVIVDIKPEIKLGNYKGLKFKKKEFEITDEELQAGIGKVLIPLGEFEAYDDDHEIQRNDFVEMDFEGSLRGEPLEGGNAYGYRVRIGEKKMIPGFEDQLIGKKKGDPFEIQVVLPQDWDKKIRRVSIPIPGAEQDDEQDVATFKVQVKDVRKLVLPELTEELVKRKEIGLDSVESFKQKVKFDLQTYKEHQEEIRIKEEIFNKLVKDNKAETPESMIKQELRYMIEGMKFQITRSGMKLEDSGFDEERAKVEWREKAIFNSKGYMLLDEIAQQEKIHVTESDIQQECERLAEETQQDVAQVRQNMERNRDNMQFTFSKLRGQKALNFIYSHCEFEFVKDDPEEGKEAEQMG